MVLSFKIHESFVKIIMMNKTYKNHKLLFNTDLIFRNNPKAKGAILTGFFDRGTRMMLNSRLA